MKKLSLAGTARADIKVNPPNSINRKRLSWLRRIINAYVSGASYLVEAQITAQFIVSRGFKNNP
jgi:hypothetical protein